MTVIDMKDQKQKGSPMLERIDDPKLRERALASQLYLQEKYSALGTWGKVAKAIRGVSEPSLVAFNSGSYNANPINIIAAIERARSIEEERASTIFTPAFAETSMARRIRKAVRQTRARGNLGICAGQSGVGKTTAFLQMLEQDPSILYVRCNPMFKSRVQPLLLVMTERLGQPAQRGTSPLAVYELVREYLSTSRRLVLFDEAQFLNREALDTLRLLSEDADTPIVFAGNDVLHELGFLAGSTPAAFVQFSSRCTVQEYLRRAEITRGDVDLIAAQRLDEETLADTRDELLAEARNEGGFRRLHTVLQRAHEKARGSAITAAQVFDAIADTSRKRGAL